MQKINRANIFNIQDYNPDRTYAFGDIINWRCHLFLVTDPDYAKFMTETAYLGLRYIGILQPNEDRGYVEPTICPNIGDPVTGSIGHRGCPGYAGPTCDLEAKL
jgi:hypothetical protein